VKLTSRRLLWLLWLIKVRRLPLHWQFRPPERISNARQTADFRLKFIVQIMLSSNIDSLIKLKDCSATAIGQLHYYMVIGSHVDVIVRWKNFTNPKNSKPRMRTKTTMKTSSMVTSESCSPKPALSLFCKYLKIFPKLQSHCITSCSRMIHQHAANRAWTLPAVTLL
jgi:hypothetical protein